MSDLINRQAALEAATKYWESEMDEIHENGFDSVADVCDLILKYNIGIHKALETLPAAQPDLWITAYEEGKRAAQPGWIPCSERLPTKREHINDMVLVCYGNGEIRFNAYINGEWAWGGYPMAWMPLPEPYKEEQDG